MNRQLVNSSNIYAIGYDANSRALEIEFSSGGIYEYYAVLPATYEGLMNASSKGRYFHLHIRDRYRFRKVG